MQNHNDLALSNLRENEGFWMTGIPLLMRVWATLGRKRKGEWGRGRQHLGKKPLSAQRSRSPHLGQAVTQSSGSVLPNAHSRLSGHLVGRLAGSGQILKALLGMGSGSAGSPRCLPLAHLSPWFPKEGPSQWTGAQGGFAERLGPALPGTLDGGQVEVLAPELHSLKTHGTYTWH